MAVPKKKKVIKIKKKTTTKKVVKKPRKKKVIKKVVSKFKLAKKVLRKKYPVILKKFSGNPIIDPKAHVSWESQAVLNPGAVLHNGRIHLFYRALGNDGVSRLGYASSKDGVHFDQRLPYPVFIAENIKDAQSHHPFTSPARLVYDTALYASGGGWGGSEDPRVVKIDGRVYITFNMFNGWDSMRVAYTSISEDDLSHKKWNWSNVTYLSRPGDRQKNWVLFPEKINGKFAILHNIDLGDSTKVHIAYVDRLNMYLTPTQEEAPDVQALPDHIVAWHNRTRSAAAPPIKTSKGWLLFYHAMDKDDPGRYKLGALLLDIHDPSKVLYRSAYPLLEPNEWYENDWKPGIIYANGAVVKDGTLFIYYGGGDKHIGVARANLKDFLSKLTKNENIVFSEEEINI